MSAYDNWLTAPLEAADERQDAADLRCERECWTEACDVCCEQAQNHSEDCGSGLEPKISWHFVLDDGNILDMFICDDCAAKFDEEERLA